MIFQFFTSIFLFKKLFAISSIPISCIQFDFHQNRSIVREAAKETFQNTIHTEDCKQLLSFYCLIIAVNIGKNQFDCSDIVKFYSLLILEKLLESRSIKEIMINYKGKIVFVLKEFTK
jgi:hypothetical protein